MNLLDQDMIGLNKPLMIVKEDRKLLLNRFGYKHTEYKTKIECHPT